MGDNEEWVYHSKWTMETPLQKVLPEVWLGNSMTKIYQAANLEKTKLFQMVHAGIPNELRGQVYCKILKVDTMNEYEKNFEMALKRTYGATVPKAPLPPMFGGRTHQNDLALTPQGVLVVDHVLCMLAHDFPSLEYCPFVTTLTSLLCHHMTSRDDLLGAMVSIVTQAFTTSKPASSPISPDTPSTTKKQKTKDWKYFATYRKDVNFMSRAFSNLLHYNNAKLYLHMSNLQSKHSEPIWTRWLTDFFVGVIPQQTVWRILDSFLLEGYKTLFRVGVALVQTRKDSILKCTNLSELMTVFEESAKSHDFLSESFLTMAWGVKISGEVDIRSGAHLHSTLASLSVADDLHEQHFRYQRAIPKLKQAVETKKDGTKTDPNAFKGSAFVKEEHWIVFWSWIPPSMRMKDLELVFTTRDHGHHITTLFNRTMGLSPLMLVVETETSIFGAYLSEAWPEEDSGRDIFYGTGETFLFTLSPFAKLYPWIGRLEDSEDISSASAPDDDPAISSRKDFIRFQASMFIMANRHEIMVGGGGPTLGLWLNEDLSVGTTGTCNTFSNNPLTGNQQKTFDCLNVEVFSFT